MNTITNETALVFGAQVERDRILSLLCIRRTTLQSLGPGWTARLREVETVIDMIQP